MISVLLISLVSFLADGKGAQFVDGYAAGVEEANRRNVPLMVFVHGSDWNLLGERLLKSAWSARPVRTSMVDLDLVLTSVDTMQTPTDEQREALDALNAGWKKKGVVTYPAVMSYLPDGSVLGSRQGETLLRDTRGAQRAILELAGASVRSQELREEIESAQQREDATGEASLILELIDLPLDRPTEMVSRLEAVDPADSAGIRRRLLLPPWQTLIATATKDAKEGRGEEALQRLKQLLDDDVYTDAQRAWLLIASGGVHRKMEGGAGKALRAFKEAWSIDREGIGGNAGKLWYLEMKEAPSLLNGWSGRHCDQEKVTWTIEDGPSPLVPGSYEVTLEYSKGRHALIIESVALIDGLTGSVVSTDTHAGSTGTASSNNTYVVETTTPLEWPHLQITCRSDGGTDSQGRISMRRLPS